MQSRLLRRDRRPGFTLLEVVLATTIGLLLMGALYAAMRAQLRLADAARARVAESTLVRNLQARIANDITANIGPVIILPKAGGGRGGGGGGGGFAAVAGAGAAAGNTSGGGAAGATQGGGNSGTGTGTGAGAATASTTGAITFNLGVQGDQSHVALYVSRLPRELDAATSGSSDGTPPGLCDLRRITYWLATGSKAGLARQELKVVTSDDLSSIPPDNLPQDEATYIIAEEVKDLAFSYFDGANWTDTWDGTTPGSDGVTPIGPPAAIAIEMGVQFPGSPDVKKFRYVVAVPAANGQGNPPPPTNPPMTAAGSSSSSSSSSPTSSNTGP